MNSSSPSVMSLIRDIVALLSSSKDNDHEHLKSIVHAELQKDNSREQNEMLHRIMYLIEQKNQTELQEATRQRDFYKAQVEEMSRKLDCVSKEKKSAEGREKLQQLLGMFQEISDARRQGNGDNMTNDYLPWCDEPKGGKRQLSHNKRGNYKGHQSRKRDDNSFCMVDHNECAPNTRGRGSGQGRPHRGRGQFHGDSQHNRSTSQGRGWQYQNGDQSSVGYHYNGSQGNTMTGQGKQLHQGSYQKSNQNRSAGDQGGFQNNGNFRGRDRGNSSPRSAPHGNKSSAAGFMHNIPAEQKRAVTADLAHINSKMQNLSTNNHSARAGNNPKPRGHQNRNKSRSSTNRSEQRHERNTNDEACVIS